jgi:RNA polymerase sigma-70 factor (ECF subfamily)
MLQQRLERTERTALAAAQLRRTLDTRAARLTRHSRADADDLVQDTLERALRNLHRFERGSNLQAWLTTIMGRLLIDQHRRRARCTPVELGEMEVPISDAGEEDRETDAIAAVARLEGAMAQLPPNFRCVLELHARMGLQYDEIARRLSLPIGTVGTRIHRARRLLRSLLDT